MKYYFFAICMLLFLDVSEANAGSKHRHTPRSTNMVAVKDTASAGIEAYSDTTVATVKTTADTVNIVNTSSSGEGAFHHSDPFDFISGMVKLGDGGVFVAILCIMFALLFLLAPFIVVAILIYFLIKRHNDKVKLTEKSIETGTPLPSNGKLGGAKDADEILWRKGINNVAVGLGLALMFWMFDTEMLVGIGLLILCYGLGQMYMARSSANKKNNRQDF